MLIPMSIKRQCLLLLLLLSCTEAFARPHPLFARGGDVKSSRRNVLQAPKTSSSSSSSSGGSLDESHSNNNDVNENEPQQQKDDSLLASSSSDAAPLPNKKKPTNYAKLPRIIQNDSQQQPQLPTIVEFVAETKLPTDLGQFQLRAYRVPDDGSVASRKLLPALGGDPCVIYATNHPPFRQSSLPVRIHDQCLTSEVFRSQRCDCKEQLQMALKHIQKHGGCIIYLQQEGRGIGLANKIAAYALQDLGLDTVDANLHLGFPEDMREYNVVPSILADLQISSIQLMTNNPRKVKLLHDLGVRVDGTLPMVVPSTNQYNVKYMETKQRRMNHDNLASVLLRSDANVVAESVASNDGAGANTAAMSMMNVIPVNGGMVPRRVVDAQADAVPTSVNGSAAADTESVQVSVLVDNAAPASANDIAAIAEGVQAAQDGYCFGKQSVLDAIDAIGRGNMVVVVDDMNRENEGDFIMAADQCSDLDMARIVRYSSGVVCVAMEEERMRQLELPPMVINNQDPKGTAFSVTVDAHKKHGISTGISAFDRAKTIRLLADASTDASDFSRPGHIFPLRAKAGGVLERDGHTEAAVDLSKLAGRAPVGVLCEIVSEEHPTEMMRLPELKRFCIRHGLVMTSIVDIAQYRRETER
ncbi:hypothetical protein MPSEU_000875100 [Mayamaea pseudoterrestris]|nr:hypothetical protein MPSEU_000875100 [Mayamaea pseudoterrestris]